MKKSRRLFVVMSLLVCVAFLVAASMVPAAAKGSRGAVKLALHERIEGEQGDGEQGAGEQVGRAIANTNADGQLIVQVHLDDGTENTTFDVYVKINGLWVPADVGELTTNRQGKGNAHLVVDLADYDSVDYSEDTIGIQVVVKHEEETKIVGYATAAEPVPLK